MKIKGLTNSVWVTILTGQDDVFKVRMLVASLQRVLTSHKCAAIWLGSELEDKNRDELTSSGFDHVILTKCPSEGGPIKLLFQDESLKPLLQSYKSVALLPVDSIVLKNCDDLVSGQRGTALQSCNAEDILSEKLEQGLVISQETEGAFILGATFHTLYTSASLQDKCLENVPSIVRTPNLTSASLPNALASVSGLLEKEILNYWDTLCNHLKRPSGTSGDNDDCVWHSEPVAVIATSDSTANIVDAAKSVFTECGLSLTTSSKTTFITTGDQAISDSIKNIPCLSKLELVTSTSSTSALTTAISKLQDNSSMTSIIFYKNGKGQISGLVLKRASQAISNGDKIQAILGPCSVFGDKSTAVEISDIVEILKSVNKTKPTVIPNFGFENDPSLSLVISTSCVEDLEKNYPKWDLKSFNLKRPLHCIALQHANSSGLDKMSENLKNALSAGELANLAYTLNTKLLSSSSLSCENSLKVSRAVIIAKDMEEAGKQLAAKSYLKEEPTLMKDNQNPKLCFLFTGQGSQFPGMAKMLYETCPVFRLSLDRCNFQFRKMYNIDIHDVIYKNSAELSRTLYSQTSIFCVEYALLQTWKSWGIEPDYVVGHSLGEFCAAVAAGALEMEDALMLVAERSRFIDQLPRGKMLVLRGDQKTIQELLTEFTWENPGSWLDFAAINSKDQTVLSGDSRWVEKFAEFAGGKKVRSLVLEATHAFHSRHMDPMLQKYRKVAEGCKGDLMPKGGVVYISGMDGKVVNGPLNADYWVRHTREPVRFVQASKAMADAGCRIFVECGPQPILSALAKVNMTAIGGPAATAVFLPSVRKGIDDWKTILNTLAKLWLGGTREVDWRGFEKYFGRRFVSNDSELLKQVQKM